MEQKERGVMLENELITVTYGHYVELENDSLLLQCLRNAGVDGWEGWEVAMEEFSDTGEE